MLCFLYCYCYGFLVAAQEIPGVDQFQAGLAGIAGQVSQFPGQVTGLPQRARREADLSSLPTGLPIDTSSLLPRQKRDLGIPTGLPGFTGLPGVTGLSSRARRGADLPSLPTGLPLDLSSPVPREKRELGVPTGIPGFTGLPSLTGLPSRLRRDASAEQTTIIAQ